MLNFNIVDLSNLRWRVFVVAGLLSLLTAAIAIAQPRTRTVNSLATPQSEEPNKTGSPPYSDYKGVRLGTTAEESRHKLGEPKDKGDEQDFYIISDKETLQIFYDKAHKVSAISIDFMGGDAPTPRLVLGSDLAAKPDGSMYKLVRYPKAGYWISYSRTAGDSPLVSITIQKSQ
jgi:hypothetical protein